MWGRRRAQAQTEATNEALAYLADSHSDAVLLLTSIDTTLRDIRDSLDRLADQEAPR